MFDNLSDRLNTVFKKLKGHGKLTENNIEEGLKEVRMALLEADAHYKVVKKLVADIKARAVGQEVMSSLTPGQQVIKIVNEELIATLGEPKRSSSGIRSRPSWGPRPKTLSISEEVIRTRTRCGLSSVARLTSP